MEDIDIEADEKSQTSLLRAIASMVATFLLGIFLPYWTGTAFNLVLAFFTTFSITFVIFLVALFPRRGFALGWKMAPFPLLMIASLAGTIHTTLAARRAMNSDLDAFERLIHRPDGTVALPAGVRAGPVTRLMIDFAQGSAQDANERYRRMRALRLVQILDPEAVRRDPALLKNCDRYRRAKNVVDDDSRRELARYAEFLGRLVQSPLDPDLKQQLLEKQKDSELRTRGEILTFAAIDRDRFDTLAALCDFLGSTSWQARDGSYVFADKAASQRFLEFSGQLAQDEAAVQQELNKGRKTVDRSRTAVQDEPR